MCFYASPTAASPPLERPTSLPCGGEDLGDLRRRRRSQPHCLSSREVAICGEDYSPDSQPRRRQELAVRLNDRATKRRGFDPDEVYEEFVDQQLGSSPPLPSPSLHKPPWPKIARDCWGCIGSPEPVPTTYSGISLLHACFYFIYIFYYYIL